jgi:hypothetical protein
LAPLREFIHIHWATPAAEGKHPFTMPCIGDDFAKLQLKLFGRLFAVDQLDQLPTLWGSCERGFQREVSEEG